MKYTIKAGVLYKNESQLALVRIKSVLLGPQRKILSIAGELLLTADARYLDESKASSGDVRNREYLLTDNENQLVGSARPGYVDGDDPNVVGWPICRMPRVDHANIVVNGEEYLLTMHNSQNYSLINAHNSDAQGYCRRMGCGRYLRFCPGNYLRYIYLLQIYRTRK